MFGQKVISMNISINRAARLYVCQLDPGVRRTSFVDVRNMVDKLCEAMSISVPHADAGSLELYQVYEDLMERFKTHPASERTWFQPGTEKEVSNVLTLAIASKEAMVIRIFLGNPETGYDWCTGNEVTGFIGRGDDIFKFPLLLESFRRFGGGLESAEYGDAIDCAHIIRMIDVLSQKELYRHPKYQMPRFQIEPADSLHKMAGYKFSVLRDDMLDTPGCNVANFESLYGAEEYVAFMKGIKVARPFRTKFEASRALLAA